MEKKESQVIRCQNQSRTLNTASKMYAYSITEQIRNIFWVFIILTHPSVLQELDFIIYTRGGGSWYFRPSSRGGLANFTPIAGMGHLISEPKFQIPTPPPPLLISDKSLSIDDGNCSEKVSFKWIPVFSISVAFIPICWKWQVTANFPGVDFLRTTLKFRERKRDSSSLVCVVHKTCNEAFSRRSRARKVKKCTKKRDARAKLLFCTVNLLLFWRPLCRRRRRC